MFLATSPQWSSKWRRWNESFGLDSGRKRGDALPLISLPFRFSSPLLSPLEAGVSLSLYTTVLTDGSDKLSWPVMSVGGYCCRGEEKQGGKEFGRATYNRVSCLQKSCICLLLLVLIKTNSLYIFYGTPLLQYYKNLEALASSDPSQAHLHFVVVPLIQNLSEKFSSGHAWGGLVGSRHRGPDIGQQQIWIRCHKLDFGTDSLFISPTGHLYACRQAASFILTTLEMNFWPIQSAVVSDSYTCACFLKQSALNYRVLGGKTRSWFSCRCLVFLIFWAWRQTVASYFYLPHWGWWNVNLVKILMYK